MSYTVYPGIARSVQTQIRLKPERIIQVVCDYFKISINDISKQSRKREYAEPRQIAIYIMTRHTILSLKEISMLFNGRDHTTMIHSRDVVSDRVSVEPTFAAIVNEVESLI